MNRLSLFILLLCFQCGAVSQDQLYVNESRDLKFLMDSLEIERENLMIMVDKSDYKLSLLSGNKVIKEYAVVFGGNLVDDKLMEGDKSTPEGSFKVRDLYPHRKWSKFIWIDYPNEESWEKHKKAKANGEIPKNAGIGGEVGIHGVPAGYDYAIDLKMNWTLGCVSLKNKDVDELYPYIYKGMLVKIQK